MYVIKLTNLFAASWLLLCLASPSRCGAERSSRSLRGTDDRREFRIGTRPETVSSEEIRTPDVQRPPYYYRRYDSARPEAPSRDVSPEIYDAFYRTELNRRYDVARRRNEEIIEKMSALDRMLSEDVENDVESGNAIDDRTSAETSIPEEAKRVVRQVRRQRPGFFWTLARLAFETFNDTRSAIQQISTIINQNIEPDTSTQRPTGRNSLRVADVKPSTLSDDQNNVSSDLASVNVTATATATTARPTRPTTQAPFKLTRTGLQDLIRKNLRGLVRLFNIEWQDAMNQSEKNVREFQKDLGNQVGGYLRDNPNAF